MAKTSLIITSTAATDGKKLQKTFTDINSTATNEQLKSFGQVLNALTTNTYVETNRVDKVNCDTEEGGGTGGGSASSGKRFRETAITGAAKSSTATITANIREGGNINPAVFYYANGSTQLLSPTKVTSDLATVAKFTVSVPNNSGYLYVGLLEDSNFYADFVHTNVE